jgi:hypothetical protein
MTAMTTFLVGIAATSAVCYVLTTRADKRRVRRPRTVSDGCSSDAGNSSDGVGIGFSGWFGHHAATDSSDHPIDGGGSDSGSGGGDGGDSGDSGGGGD